MCWVSLPGHCLGRRRSDCCWAPRKNRRQLAKRFDGIRSRGEGPSTSGRHWPFSLVLTSSCPSRNSLGRTKRPLFLLPIQRHCFTQKNRQISKEIKQNVPFHFLKQCQTVSNLKIITRQLLISSVGDLI